MRALLIHPRAPYALLALTCVTGWLFKAHCGAVWTGGEQYLTGCYSDAVPFWGLRGVAAGELPYAQARIEYPVLTGALIWIEGLIARAIGGAETNAAHFLFVVAAVNAALAFAVMRMMERAGVDRTRLLWWAGSPLLVLYLGHNWDMLAVALAVAALLSARRGQDVRAAALAALGGAAKLFPLLMLPLLGFGALRRGVRVAVRAGVAAVAVWSAVNLPVAALAFANWSEFYSFSQARSGTAASLWEVASTQGWWTSDVATRNTHALLLFALGVAAIVVIGWRRHRHRLWSLFTPVLAWFLLTNKVYSPQFDLWLYPFLLLTSRRLWPVAAFAFANLLAYWAEFWWFATLESAPLGVTTTHIAIAAGIRAAVLLWLVASALAEPPPPWLDEERA